MNIANIFGLHIGCIIRLENGKQFKVDGVCYGKSSNRPMVRCNDEDLSLYIDHCKLLLKPLSAISEEDKAEFQNIMMCGFKFEKVYLYDINKGHPNYKKQWIIIAKTIVGTELFVNSPDQILWLASKGYDVGIVPDEYKEIYHGK